MDQYYCNMLTMGWRLPLIIIIFVVNASSYANGFIGIDWGRMASQRIVPSMVVDMLLQTGISEVKIFSASDNVLEAFEGTDIGITVTIPNEYLKLLMTVEDCNLWIQRNLITNINNGVNIRYVTVGSQPYSGLYFNKTYYNALPVLKNMVIALNQTDFGGKVVKPTMNHFMDIMDSTLKPSESDFNPEIRDLVIQTLNILRDADAPMTLDTFPIHNALNFTNDIEFAFFYNNSTAKFMDGEFIYRNIFEAMYDKMICALEKNGLSGLKVFGGQLGWPTDGIEGGNTANAQRFHNGLVKYFLHGKGTPRHPGTIDVFLHNFADENRLSFKNETRYNRHWGIYRFDGEPKFSIDFTSNDRDIKPVSAKGVTRMPKRWCVINKAIADQLNNVTLVKEQTEKACNQSDCTCMSPGGSCGGLDLYSKASYAFNMFYQIKSQKISENACMFEGLGLIVPDDPSTDECSFPVGIIPAEYTVDNNGTYRQMSASTVMINMILLWNILVIILMYL